MSALQRRGRAGHTRMSPWLSKTVSRKQIIKMNVL
jgi:hypothetical protein